MTGVWGDLLILHVRRHRGDLYASSWDEDRERLEPCKIGDTMTEPTEMEIVIDEFPVPYRDHRLGW